MTSPRRFEQDVPVLLADLYVAGTPVYRDDLVQQVARTRQRPAWTFPGRWLPVELVTTRVSTTRFPTRQLGVLALIAILLAAALAVYVGSQQQTLPPPFGVARSGLVAYDSGGDIFVVDPATGESRAIVTGPELDTGPRFSRDGTHIVFARDEGGPTRLFVAAADGSGLTSVTPDPFRLTPPLLGEPWERYQFSPDGRSVLIADTGGLSLVASDGSGNPIRIQAEMYVTEPSFRPPDGREILFVGRLEGGNHGLFVVDLSTHDVRTVVKAPLGFDLAGANWSPDGSQVAYWMWGGPGSDVGVTARTHVINADGTGDRLLEIPPGAFWMMGSDWSNDGTRLFLLRGYSRNIDAVRPAVVPADGSSVGVEIPIGGSLIESCCGFFDWAPDDSVILGRPADETGQPGQQMLIEPDARTYRTAPWTSTSDPTWQRRAP